MRSFAHTICVYCEEWTTHWRYKFLIRLASDPRITIYIKYSVTRTLVSLNTVIQTLSPHCNQTHNARINQDAAENKILFLILYSFAKNKNTHHWPLNFCPFSKSGDYILILCVPTENISQHCTHRIGFVFKTVNADNVTHLGDVYNQLLPKTRWHLWDLLPQVTAFKCIRQHKK